MSKQEPLLSVTIKLPPKLHQQVKRAAAGMKLHLYYARVIEGGLKVTPNA